MQPVHDLLGDAHEVLDQERLGDKLFHAVHQRPEALLDVRAARHEQKRNVPRRFSRAQLLKKPAPVESRHFVIAQDHIRRIIDHFEQGISAVHRRHYVARVLQPFHDQVAHQGIVFRQEQFDGRSAHRARLRTVARSCLLPRCLRR